MYIHSRKRTLKKSSFAIIFPSICLLIALSLVITGFIFCLRENCEATGNFGNKWNESEDEDVKRVSGNGKYFLFRTNDVVEYFNFLNNFNDTKYEIIDISTSYCCNNKFYLITYKSK